MTKITDNYTEKNTKNEFCTRETGEGMIEKEDFMKDDEAQEISGKMRKESKMYNQGI